MAQQLYLSQREYEQIQQIFKYHVLKLFVKICMSNIRSAVSFMKINYQVKKKYGDQSFNNSYKNQHERTNKATAKIFNVISSHHQNRKKQFFAQIEDIFNNSKYSKSKALLFLRRMLILPINNRKRHAFQKLKDNLPQQISNQQLIMVKTCLKCLILRSLTQPFQMIKSYSHSQQSLHIPNQTKKIQNKQESGSFLLFLAVQSIIKKIYSATFRQIRECYKQIESNNFLDNDENSSYLFNPQHDENEIQINQIKSILEITKRQFQKFPLNGSLKSITSKKSTQEFYGIYRSPLNRIFRLISRKRRSNLEQSFGILRWKLLEIYDNEMIQKLEVEINVLQHEFDSL